MTEYLLTAAGVIFLTVIVSFIIPEGKLNKSINFVLRLVCIGVLLQPALSLFSFSPTVDKPLADYDYICSVYSQTQSEQLTKIVLEETGVECECVIDIAYDGKQIYENGVVLKIKEIDDEKINAVCEYLQGLGYIHITVDEQSG